MGQDQRIYGHAEIFIIYAHYTDPYFDFMHLLTKSTTYQITSKQKSFGHSYIISLDVHVLKIIMKVVPSFLNSYTGFCEFNDTSLHPVHPSNKSFFSA